MRTIYKYPIGHNHIPKGAIFRHAAIQDGNLYVWFEVETENPTKPTIIRFTGTGNFIYDGWDYLSTVIENQNGNNLVWHIFLERLP